MTVEGGLVRPVYAISWIGLTILAVPAGLPRIGQAKYSQTDKAPTMTEPTRATERAADKAPGSRRLYQQIADRLRELIRQGSLASAAACRLSGSWRCSSACRGPRCVRP